MSILTTETLPAYLTEHSAAIGVLGVDAVVTCTELHGGNLNYAFHATDGQHSLFVKQAPDFIKCFGPDAKLHRERMQLEVDVYQRWGEQLKEDATKYLPQIYFFDPASMVFVMEFLGSHTLLEELLQTQAAIPHPVWESIGAFMSFSHARTHSTVVSEDRALKLHEEFKNPVLREIQLAYVFSKCYQDSENPAGKDNSQGIALGTDEAFMAEVEMLRAAYRGEQAQNRALCHGDLHAGSLMVNCESGSAKVIDPEFCVYGPPGLDLGSLLASVVICALNARFGAPQASSAWAVQAVTAVWDSYSQRLRAEGLSEDILQQIAADSIGFTCAEVARTSLGFAGVRCLQLEGDEHKAALDAALGLVRRCMLGRSGASCMEVLTLELVAFDSLKTR